MQRRNRVRQNRLLNRIVWGIFILSALLYFFAFLGEYYRSIEYFWRLLRAQVGGPMPSLTASVHRDLQITTVTFLGGTCLTGFIWLWLNSMQTVLPVENLIETLMTFIHQLVYLVRGHGQAVFARDGHLVENGDEVNRPGPGVVVIDYNSAVVIEHMMGQSPILLLQPFNRFFRRLMNQLIRRFIPNSRILTPQNTPQVYTHGIVFTGPYERVRGVVDLRKQTRSRPKIRAYTRDGIEVTSNVFAVFSVAQEPDIIEVVYCGGDYIDNLHVVETTLNPDGTVRVHFTGDEILKEDMADIHAFAQTLSAFTTPAPSRFRPYQPLQLPLTDEEIDRERIFAAVFAQARNPDEDIPLNWSDLPARVAADLFRETLSKNNYDSLYQFDAIDPSRLTLTEVRRDFRARMRNYGVLSCRVLRFTNGNPDFPEDFTCPRSEVAASVIHRLTTPQILRERGIKVITSGFSNPAPSEEVYRQKMEAWRAHWQRERVSIAANRDLEATRIRNRASALAQHDIILSLRKIFDQEDVPQEALALRVMQALEAAAADPKTNQLLPADTIKLLEQIIKLLGEAKP